MTGSAPLHVLAAGALLAATAAAPQPAAAFPDEPITIVVGWPAGGAQDTVGRLVAEYLEAELPVSVVVTNVPGAAGANGVRDVEQAAPDGYTLGTKGVHAVAQSYMNPNATPLDAMDPLALVNIDPAAVSVHADTGIEDLESFIAYLRDNPGGLINGNDSPGGFSFLTAELMERALDIELTKVPYQGYAPTVSALVAQEVMSATLPVPMVADLHEAGDVNILAVAAEERHFRAPDVPTFTELGHDFVFADYVMIFGPVGLPEDVRDTLESALLAAMDSEDFRAAADGIGLILDPQGADGAAALMQATDAAVHPVLVEAGLVETDAQ